MKRKNKSRCSQCDKKIGFLSSKFKTKKGLMCLDCYLKYTSKKSRRIVEKEGDYRCPQCNKKLNYEDFAVRECTKCHTTLKIDNYEGNSKQKKKAIQYVFCYKCGKKNLSSDNFCKECGIKLKKNADVIEEKEKKSQATAIILAVLLSGAGHMYAGKVGKGFVILAIQLFLVFGIRGFGSIIAIVLFIWQIIDANKEVENYNRSIQ